jgi:hypothetical protein
VSLSRHKVFEYVLQEIKKMRGSNGVRSHKFSTIFRESQSSLSIVDRKGTIWATRQMHKPTFLKNDRLKIYTEFSSLGTLS